VFDEGQEEGKISTRKEEKSYRIQDLLGAEGGHAHHAFGELMVHQLIETIEFVLGTVSNTASYLRLWALSLAHSKLAEVFYEYSIKIGLSMGSKIIAAVAMPFLFIFFFTVTFFVLLCMDVMEAFLHTLRLHWVEFQNKFYKGNGYKYQPFSFERVLKSKAE